MKKFLLCVLLGHATCAWAEYPYGDDLLCQKIANFANSTPIGETRSVSLETSWGPNKISSDDVFGYKECRHKGYQPGREFCSYLLHNSATEFYQNNFVRALSCLNNSPVPSNANPVRYKKLDVEVSAYNAYGVSNNIEVTIRLSPNEEHGTAQLDIMVKAHALER